MSDWKIHELQLATGLATKLVPEAVAGKAAVQASNVDGFDTFLGMGKLPGSTVLNEASTAGRIDSIHYFEYFDLDRSSKRACVVHALDGGVARLKTVALSGGAVTNLLDDNGGNAFSTAEALTAVATLNHRLHLSSPNQTGTLTPTGGRKFDGSRVTNWGALAPGQDSVLTQALDDASVWSGATSLPTSVTPVTNTTNKIRGTGSVAFTPTNSAQTLVRLTRSFAAANFDSTGSTLQRVWLFIPSGGLQDLGTAGAVIDVEVQFTSTGPGTALFRFTRGSLVPGWNLLSMDFDTPTATTGAFNKAAVTAVQLDVAMSGASISTTAQWAWNFMFNPDRGDPLAALSAGTAFDGSVNADTYSFRVTFLTEYGLETNAGPASNTVTIAGAPIAIQLTNVPVSADPSVIARRIYAIKNSTGGYGFVTQIDNNTATTSPLLNAAFSIGLTSPPLAGDLDLDSSPPEPFLDAIALNARIFAIDAATRLSLFISELGQGEAFPVVNTIGVDEPMTAVRDHPDGLLVYTSDKTFQLSGDGTVASPFSLQLINAELGANGPRAVASAQGVNVAVREKQVYLIEKAANPWYLNGPVQDQWDSGMLSTALGDMFVVSDRGRYRVVFFGKGAGGAFDQLWSYQHTTQAKSDSSQFEGGVDPQDLRNGAWFRITPPSGVTPLCAAIGERSSEVPELWVGTSEGYVHVFQDPTTRNWFTGFGSVPVDATWESSDLPLGSGPDGFGHTAWLAFNHSNPNAPGGASTTWDVTITYLTGAGGAVLGTKTIQVTFQPGTSAPRVALPHTDFPTASWARVKLANARTAEGGVFRNVRLYFTPVSDWLGPTDD